MRNWKAILGVLLVFALGMLAGGLITAKWFQREIHRFAMGDSDHASEMIVNRLSRRLRLDDSQRAQLEAAVTDARREMKVIHQQAHPQIERVMTNAEAKVRAVLRPDQQKKFDAIMARRRARWRVRD